MRMCISCDQRAAGHLQWYVPCSRPRGREDDVSGLYVCLMGVRPTNQRECIWMLLCAWVETCANMTQVRISSGVNSKAFRYAACVAVPGGLLLCYGLYSYCMYKALARFCPLKHLCLYILHLILAIVCLDGPAEVSRVVHSLVMSATSCWQTFMHKCIFAC